MASKEQKPRKEEKKVAKMSIKEKRKAKMEKKKSGDCAY